MKHVDLYTDGACSGNPGVGGYGAILIFKGIEKEISKGFLSTTNNRMEISAVIAGLEMLKERCDVTVYSDSAYTVNAFNQGWIWTWIKNDWKKADGKDVLNSDLWKHLLTLTNKRIYFFSDGKIKFNDLHSLMLRYHMIPFFDRSFFLRRRFSPRSGPFRRR